MIKRLYSWLDSVKIYWNYKMLVIALLGFSSGLPFLLVFSTLSLWLRDAGADLAIIGYISLVRSPYSFKFLWAPIVDRFNIPYFTAKLGRRRSWAVLTQILLIISLLGIAFTVPQNNNIVMTAILAFMVAFCSASQDIVVDAYRIEIVPVKEQGAASAMSQLGYRFGMIVAGAGALYLNDFFAGMAFVNDQNSLIRTFGGQNFGAWNLTYLAMAGCAFIGLFTSIFLAKEPEVEAFVDKDLKVIENQYPDVSKKVQKYLAEHNFTFAIRVHKAFNQAVVAPFVDFLKKPHWILILLFVMTYKIPDSYIGPMAMPFYDDLGFTKSEIATIQKIYGILFTIFGTLIGGVLVAKFGTIKSLFGCGILMAISNFAFSWLALQGHNTNAFIIAIAMDNISGGMSLAAYVAYLSGLCSVAFTATQYALFSSIMGFGRDVIATTSGILANMLGWFWFFNITVLMVIPSLIILWILVRKLPNVKDSKDI